MFTFDSQVQLGPKTPQYSQEMVKNEPMLFNCSSNFSYSNGGPITRDFLELLYENNEIDPEIVVIDSRVHMSFKEGIYLCIPGFHGDDVPRTRSDGQPNYYNPEYKSKHCMMLVNGEVAPTTFALGVTNFPDVPLGTKCYKIWHDIVEQYIISGQLAKWICPSNRLVYFDWQTWHKGVPTVKTGWRFFIRASWNTDRIKSVTNEVRRQVQVYLPLPTEGW